MVTSEAKGPKCIKQFLLYLEVLQWDMLYRQPFPVFGIDIFFGFGFGSVFLCLSQKFTVFSIWFCNVIITSFTKITFGWNYLLFVVSMFFLFVFFESFMFDVFNVKISTIWPSVCLCSFWCFLHILQFFFSLRLKNSSLKTKTIQWNISGKVVKQISQFFVIKLFVFRRSFIALMSWRKIFSLYSTGCVTSNRIGACCLGKCFWLHLFMWVFEIESELFLFSCFVLYVGRPMLDLRFLQNSNIFTHTWGSILHVALLVSHFDEPPAFTERLFVSLISIICWSRNFAANFTKQKNQFHYNRILK